MAITAAQLRELADRARASAEGITLHWPANPRDPPAPHRAARQCASVWSSLARSPDAPTSGLALTRAPDGSGGYIVRILHALSAPLDALVSDAATGAPLPEYAPEALEAHRLAALCVELGGPVCPLSPAEAARFWKLRPDQAADIWEANGWPLPLAQEEHIL